MKKLGFILLVIILFNAVIPVSAVGDGDGQMRIALTFDDGPHGEYTGQILEILDKYNIKATFFVIGCNVKEHPELLKQINDKGHETGNHTYYHKRPGKLTCKDVVKEVKQTDELIYEITGKIPDLFRPPEGVITSELASALSSDEKRVVLWNLDTRDWAHTPSDIIVKNVVSKAKDGSIVLFHDYVAGSSPTPNALIKIIPALIERGFVFVTVSEMIEGQQRYG